MTSPQSIVNRLTHFTAEAYNEHPESEAIQKLRHDYECAVWKAIEMYREANEDIRPEVVRYNELVLKIKMSLGQENCRTVNKILKMEENLRNENPSDTYEPQVTNHSEIVDRLVYLTAEAYQDDFQSEALQKLRHDYECALEDAVQTYKKSYNKMHQESIRYNEFVNKVKSFLGQKNCDHVDRILTWNEDLNEGMSIRRSHGYIK
ncbi:hypothetical protein GCM10010954_30250 [Halobacillus andaensis]|uniref:Uncharacterized protein n=1 Tax=Halobacillus andaensis TaxID=1176239 RepID=A0A917BAZ4_HALAA|nr:hypothetical protein [Halobacillus andaensis]MBP2005130.1 hypothetical protein [Halobacillus andaensis]GGF29088.1 hypothetical protein GCM10010954_30250 [Halobacillus andaensis]